MEEPLYCSNQNGMLLTLLSRIAYKAEGVIF